MTIILNGLKIEVEEYWTLLEAAKFYGTEIPTLCYREGLSSYGACRLCLVEIGEGNKSKLVTSCTYPVQEGLIVRTDSKRAIEQRLMLIELMLASTPQSKTIQDLAAKHGVTKVRFKQEHEDCLLCGLCVRMCEEQMQAKALGFAGRGKKRRVTTPFDMKSDMCRTCGACMYICPACQLRCQGTEPPGVVCGSCLSMAPTCLEYYGEVKK